jgi:hypothetical protein
MRGSRAPAADEWDARLESEEHTVAKSTTNKPNILFIIGEPLPGTSPVGRSIAARLKPRSGTPLVMFFLERDRAVLPGCREEHKQNGATHDTND